MTQAIKTWFKKGDYVWVINRTYGGTFIVEGKAAVLKVLGEDRALVCFDNGDKVERFIEKEAQANPEEYVAMLNRCESKYSDTVAMHMIQKILDGTDWKVDMLDDIAGIVRDTGREVRDVLEEDDDA